MGDILDEAYAIAQCKDCPWYKSCVMPMRFTAEDIRRQLESSAPGMNISPTVLKALATRVTMRPNFHMRSSFQGSCQQLTDTTGRYIIVTCVDM